MAIDISPKETEELINKVANQVHKYKLNVAAILMIESFKPLAYISGQMGRFFLLPFLPAFGEDIGIGGEKFFTVFEKRENIEKLVQRIEELAKEEEEKEKVKKDQEKAQKGKEDSKKGWRRYLPF